MFVHDIETFLPDRGAALHAAQLAAEQGIEAIQVMLGPANAGAGHHACEALLVDTDSVLDKIEVNEGDLKDVERKIALENTCPVEEVRIYTMCVLLETYRMRFAITSDRTLR